MQHNPLDKSEASACDRLPSGLFFRGSPSIHRAAVGNQKSFASCWAESQRDDLLKACKKTEV